MALDLLWQQKHLGTKVHKNNVLFKTCKTVKADNIFLIFRLKSFSLMKPK